MRIQVCKHGNEVDVVIDKGDQLIPVEIKASKKISQEHERGVQWFNKVFRQTGGIVLYGGNVMRQQEGGVTHLGWKSVSEL